MAKGSPMIKTSAFILRFAGQGGMWNFIGGLTMLSGHRNPLHTSPNVNGIWARYVN